jgi:hypothetical protein
MRLASTHSRTSTSTRFPSAPYAALRSRRQLISGSLATFQGGADANLKILGMWSPARLVSNPDWSAATRRSPRIHSIRTGTQMCDTKGFSTVDGHKEQAQPKIYRNLACVVGRWDGCHGNRTSPNRETVVPEVERVQVGEQVNGTFSNLGIGPFSSLQAPAHQAPTPRARPGCPAPLPLGPYRHPLPARAPALAFWLSYSLWCMKTSNASPLLRCMRPDVPPPRVYPDVQDRSTGQPVRGPFLHFIIQHDRRGQPGA